MGLSLNSGTGRSVLAAVLAVMAGATPNAVARTPKDSVALPKEQAMIPPQVPSRRAAICARLDRVLRHKLAAAERHKTLETRRRLSCVVSPPGEGSSHPPRPRHKPHR